MNFDNFGNIESSQSISTAPRVASLTRISSYLLIFLSVSFFQLELYLYLVSILSARLIYIFISKKLYFSICIILSISLFLNSEYVLSISVIVHTISQSIAYFTALDMLSSNYNPVFGSSHAELNGTASILSLIAMVLLVISLISSGSLALVCLILFGVLCLFTILPGLISG